LKIYYAFLWFFQRKYFMHIQEYFLMEMQKVYPKGIPFQNYHIRKFPRVFP